MKAQELRIGNYCQDKELRLCKVEGLAEEMYDCKIRAIKSSITSMPISPIQLTEELFIKLGFEKSDYPNFTLKVGALKLICRLSIGINYSEFAGIYFGDRFKYVHELQNFIYSVSGQELTIK